MRSIVFGAIVVLLLYSVVQAQEVPVCEELLSQTQLTLSFVQASRQYSEDNDGRVVMILQKQLKQLQHENDVLKKKSESSNNISAEKKVE